MFRMPAAHYRFIMFQITEISGIKGSFLLEVELNTLDIKKSTQTIVHTTPILKHYTNHYY
jgi:hypothetical protein